MSFGIPVRNGLSIGLLASTFLTSGSARLIPRLTLNFLTGAPLDSRITFTRSTTATFVGSNGLIQTAAINAPRFGYNPVTLASLGLLIEEQRTNLILQSDNFSTTWVADGATVTINVATSPDGTQNADLINSTTNNWRVQQDRPVSGSTAYICSAFVKKGNSTTVKLEAASTGGVDPNVSGNLYYNFDTNTITGTGSIASPTVTPYGNGWFRISGKLTTSASHTTMFLYCYGGAEYGAAGQTNWWGFQLEAGAFATSYIPTAASTVARTADIAVMTGTNFSSWYNASEGTFVSSFEASPNTFTTYVAASNGVVAQNSMHMYNDGSGNMRVAYYSGSSAVALLSLGAVGTLGAVNTLATAYKVNDFAASRNGGAVVTDTLGAVPAGVTQLNIGADPSGAAVNVSNTHIRSITYYRSRLTNAQLQTLSA